MKCFSVFVIALLFCLFAKAQVQLKVAFNLSSRIAYSKEKSETFALKTFTYAIPVSFGGIAKFNNQFAIDCNYSPSIISIKAKNKIQVNSNPNYTYSYQIFSNQFSSNFYVLVKDNSNVAKSNKIYFTFGPSFMLAKIVTHSFSSGRGNTIFESNIRSSQEILPPFDEIINNKLGFQIGMHVAKTYQNNRIILFGLQFFLLAWEVSKDWPTNRIFEWKLFSF